MSRTTVSGDAALTAYRKGLTGRYALELLRANGGGVLARLPVGVGKSWWLDDITREAVRADAYDLVAVFCPTRQLIEERRPLRDPPAGLKVINLRPRPARRCGPRRDAEWRRYEAADMGALGRIEVCGSCPLRKQCFWPRQYGKAMRQARIVYATQAHLERSPGFLINLRAWTGARRSLTLLDESQFVGTSFERAISRTDLDRFVDVLRQASPWCQDPGWNHRQWLDLATMLQVASPADLQEGNWRMPFLNPRWAAVVQSTGLQRYGGSFRFLGYDLTQFGFSPADSRGRGDNGDLRFSIRPLLGDCIVFSGTTDAEFARFRLGRDLASPFEDYRFVHPQTRWYNLASPAGSRRYFPRHASQVLDFFAGLVALRVAAGRRVLLVAKKCFLELCRQGLGQRFRELGLDLEVATEGWSEELLGRPEVVPLISYGMIGTNLFEEFDAVYCLTGFYVNEAVLNACLQDVTRQELRLPLKIETSGVPRRRRAGVLNPGDRYYDVARLAQPALEFQEHGVVIQAVGRVRPFTRPREVVTFQMATLPGVAYDAEFQTLAEARRFFKVPTRRQREKDNLAARVRDLRQQGLTQAEAARRLGISDRTVRRYEKRPPDR